MNNFREKSRRQNAQGTPVIPMEEANNQTSTVDDGYERLQQQNRNNNYDGEGYLNPTGPGEHVASVSGDVPHRPAQHQSAHESQVYEEIM